MDIEEFEKSVTPKAKRSRLEPYQAQIFELKEKGYSNLQVREWLAANDVSVSQEAVRKFIKKREGNIDLGNTSAVETSYVPSQPVENETISELDRSHILANPVKTTPTEQAGVSEFQKQLEAPIEKKSYKAILAQQQKEDNK